MPPSELDATTNTVIGIFYRIRFVNRGLARIPPCKSIPACQKCLLTFCPASNSSSMLRSTSIVLALRGKENKHNASPVKMP
jgi:hypothetical protein